MLTKQELVIMRVIWERGSATVKEVCDTLSQRKVTAYTTVLTFMRTLESKGVLVRKRKDRSHLYFPVLSRQQATNNQVNDLLVRLFDSNPNKLIEAIRDIKFKTSGSKALP